MCAHEYVMLRETRTSCFARTYFATQRSTHCISPKLMSGSTILFTHWCTIREVVEVARQSRSGRPVSCSSKDGRKQGRKQGRSRVSTSTFLKHVMVIRWNSSWYCQASTLVLMRDGGGG